MGFLHKSWKYGLAWPGFFAVAFWSLTLLVSVPVRAQDSLLWSDFRGYPAVVVGDVCNLRSGPGTSWPVVGQVRQGDRLPIQGAEGAWVKVGYRGREAWIAGWLLEVDLTGRSLVAVVERTNVNLREGPGLDFRVVGMTTRGERFPAQVRRGDWIRVERGSGSVWVWAPLVRLAEEPPAPGSPLPGGPPGAEPDIPPSQTAPPLGDLLVYPSGEDAKIHRTANKGSAILGILTTAHPCRYLSGKGGWIQVELPGGDRGWVWGPEARLEHPQDRQVRYLVSDSLWKIEKYPLARVRATNVNFRSGPGTGFKIIGRLDRGDTLRVLESAKGWIRAVAPSGQVGWVAGWLTGGVEAPRDQFLVSLEGGKASRRLTVVGPFRQAAVMPQAEGKSLLVSASASFQGSGALGVGSYEVEGMRVVGQEVWVDFHEQPFYQVIENVPGRVVVELRPVVTSLSLRQEEGRDILSLGVLGYAWPEVRRNSAFWEVFLPGATYSGDRPAMRGGVVRAATVEQVEAGVIMRLETDVDIACYLRKEPNQLQMHFAPPGLAGKKVVIDPGHGGEDPGAVGPTGLLEKTVNLEIANRLAQLLREEGAQVRLTREGDFPASVPPDWDTAWSEYDGELARRAAWSRDADVFISVHNDFHPNRTASGTTTYLCSEILNSAESARLARLIQAELVAELGTLDRGVKDSNFFVLRHAACPAVLVEVMYLSHPGEESLLRQEITLDKAARGILRGLRRYFGTGSLPVASGSDAAPTT